MSLKAEQIENALQAALTLPTPVAARVAVGDAFALPLQDADGVTLRLSDLARLDGDMADESASAQWDCELVLQRHGPLDTSATQALQALITSVHARLVADRKLGGVVNFIKMAENNPLSYEKTSGGELPAYSATMRYEIYSNINPQTLGA